VILEYVRSRKWLLALVMVAAVGCSGRACTGCRGCGGVETCDDCVQRCLDTQGGSPEVCRGSLCASTPSDPNAKFPACRPIP
jgi:hypothetical protein